MIDIKTILIYVLSLLPALIIFLYILMSDIKSKEPLLLMIMCLLSGLITTYLSLNIQRLVMNSIVELNKLDILKLITLAFIEESTKFFLLYVFMSHTKNFDDIYDGFVYSETIALSFGITEIIMYAYTETTITGIGFLTISRLFTSLPLHLVCGILMGHYVSLERFSTIYLRKIQELIKCLFIPSILHGLYNIFLFYLIYVKYSQIVLIVGISFIYLIGLIYITRTKLLNEKFIENRAFPKRYKFLMNKRLFNKKKKVQK